MSEDCTHHALVCSSTNLGLSSWKATFYSKSKSSWLLCGWLSFFCSLGTKHHTAMTHTPTDWPADNFWPKPRTMINFTLSLSTSEAWSAQDYKRWHCLLIIEDFWGICIGNLWSEIDFCGKRVNLHKTDFTTVESYRTLRQFCTACSLVQDSIINTAATTRYPEKIQLLIPTNILATPKTMPNGISYKNCYNKTHFSFPCMPFKL